MGPGQVHSQHDCLDSSWLEKFLVMLAVLLIVTLLNYWMATQDFVPNYVDAYVKLSAVIVNVRHLRG